ncbi:hypothetical protein [Pseudomonas sp. LB3P31]
MAKPPINPGIKPNPSGPARVPTPDDPLTGVNIGRPGSPPRDGGATPGTSTTEALPGQPARQPVVVTDMPSGGTQPSFTLDAMVSWPREQVDQLIRVGDTGLFMSKDGELYADMGNAGIARAQPDGQGNYQVHLRGATSEAGPTLRKVEGRPAWQILQPVMTMPAGPSSTATSTNTLPVKLVNPQVAQRLPAANEAGIRWHNLRSYVELKDEGMVQIVRNTDGEYQVTHGQEWEPSGPVLERVGHTTQWQRKVADTDGAPAKRPRLEGNDEPANPDARGDDSFSLSSSHPASENPYLWVSWGKVDEPVAVDSIPIGGLHYRTVPTGTKNRQFVVYLQHPDFPLAGFDGFEQMLHSRPWMQPLPIIPGGGVDATHRMFAKPMVESVAEAFPDFSPITARAVARQLYELSSDSPVMNRDGLYTTALTLRHWKEKAGIFDPDFENPIDLLPVAPRVVSDNRVIDMAPPLPGESLRRLDFSIANVRTAWDTYATAPSDHALKLLVAYVLARNGYEIFPLQNHHRPPKLVFRRKGHEKVYYLKLGVAENNAIAVNPAPVPELADPSLPAHVGVDAVLELAAANARNNVVWLLGGIHTSPTGWQSIFIMKER